MLRKSKIMSIEENARGIIAKCSRKTAVAARTSGVGRVRQNGAFAANFHGCRATFAAITL
jgi:hypothetical protein